MDRMIFVNLPTGDLAAATGFYGALGFTRNEQFSTDESAIVDVTDTIKLILHTEPRFAQFLAGPRATGTEVLLAFSAASREEVDALHAAARAAGAGEWLPAQDHGFMYGVSFTDLDGHVVEVTWMDAAAATGAADTASATAAG